jgi:hypothetical protein
MESDKEIGQKGAFCHRSHNEIRKMYGIVL